MSVKLRVLLEADAPSNMLDKEVIDELVACRYGNSDGRVIMVINQNKVGRWVSHPVVLEVHQHASVCPAQHSGRDVAFFSGTSFNSSLNWDLTNATSLYHTNYGTTSLS